MNATGKTPYHRLFHITRKGETNMKTKKQFSMTALALVAILTLAVTACDNGDEEKPDVAKDQTATRILAHGVGTVTITGFMTNAQWKDVADKIKSKIDAKIGEQIEEHGDIVADNYKEVFARGITYIVETNPVGYNSYKTTGDGKTAYVALDKLDTENWVVATLTSIAQYTVI
jgi:hypothetical protein